MVKSLYIFAVLVLVFIINNTYAQQNKACGSYVGDDYLGIYKCSDIERSARYPLNKKKYYKFISFHDVGSISNGDKIKIFTDSIEIISIYNNIDNSWFKELNFPKLREIDIDYCYYNFADSIGKLYKTYIEIVSKSPVLEVLSMNFLDSLGLVLEAVPNKEQLKEVHVSGYFCVSPNRELLYRFVNLEHICIHGEVDALHLDLYNFPKLRSLNCDLDLQKTEIIEYISKYPNLEHFYTEIPLSQIPIGIENLAFLKKLDVVIDSSFSLASKATMQRLLPNTEIKFYGPFDR